MTFSVNNFCKFAFQILVLTDTSKAFFIAGWPCNRDGTRHRGIRHPNRRVLQPAICLETPRKQSAPRFGGITALGVSNTPAKVSQTANESSDAAASESGKDENDGANAEAGAEVVVPASVAVSKKSPFATVANGSVSRFRQLKDVMWVREAVEDVTAAKFACSVESSAVEEANNKRKRAVDYEKLLSQLDRRVGDMLCRTPEELNGSEPIVDKENGMGRFVYSQEERVELLK